MKGRKGKASGGTNLADDDLNTKNQRYTYQSKVNDEAEERKEGGKVKGKDAKPSAARKPRKSGGRTGADQSPFSSARNGTLPKGHSAQSIE